VSLHWERNGRQDPARGRLAALSAAFLNVLACFSGAAPDHAAITQEAVATFKALSARHNWDSYLTKYLNPTDSTRKPQYDASYLAWGTAYQLQARLAMFEATREARHLEYLLSSGETIFAHRADRLQPPLRDDVRDVIAPAWVSYAYTQPRWYAWFGHAGMITYPLAGAIRHVKSDPSLEATHGARAAALAADMVETLDFFEPDYRTVAGTNEGYYHNSYGGGELPFNLYNATGRTYIALWRATGQQRFRERAEALARHMKAELTAVDDRYRWRYATYRPGGSAEDFSHAGINVNFMIDAYEAGIVFDDTDMQRLANTLRYVSRGTDGFTVNIDGSGGLDDSYSMQAGRWMRLAHFDGALREELLPYFRNLWAGGANILSMIAVAHYVETGRTYETQAGFADTFDGLQLDRRWQRNADQRIGDTWKTEMMGGHLLVTDVDTDSAEECWVAIERRRAIDVSGRWNADMTFSWVSSEPGADPLHAMQQFCLALFDDGGACVARVGIRDAWVGHRGRRVVRLGDQELPGRYDDLPFDGRAVIRIESDPHAHRTSIFWDGELLLSGEDLWDLAAVELVFQYYNHPESHFGIIVVDEVSLAGIPPAPGDANQDGVVDDDDLSLLLANWTGAGGAGGTWATGDFDGNGAVSDVDLSLLLANWGASEGGMVPEPAGLALLAVAGWACPPRRRRTGRLETR